MGRARDQISRLMEIHSLERFLFHIFNSVLDFGRLGSKRNENRRQILPVSGETRSIDGKNNRNRPISFPILQTNLETRNTNFFSFFHSVKWLDKLNVVFYYRLINREQGLFRVCIRYGANVPRVYRRVSIRFIHDTALQLENEQNNMLPFIVHTFVTNALPSERSHSEKALT